MYLNSVNFSDPSLVTGLFPAGTAKGSLLACNGVGGLSATAVGTNNSLLVFDSTTSSGFKVSADPILSSLTLSGAATVGSLTASASVTASNGSSAGIVVGPTSIATSFTDQNLVLSTSGTGRVILPASSTTPDVLNQAVSKAYVDSLASGFKGKTPVRCRISATLPAFTAAGSKRGKTLTANAAGIFPPATADNLTTALTLGDRVLIDAPAFGGTPSVHSGIYTMTTVGTASVPWVFTRAQDSDGNSAGQSLDDGTLVFVAEGTIYSEYGYIQTAAGIVVDTGIPIFTQFGAAGKTFAGGAANQIQYNVGGLLSGSSNLIFNGTTLKVNSFAGLSGTGYMSAGSLTTAGTSVALGSTTVATGDGTVALGGSARGLTDGAIAIGDSSTATSAFSIALGYLATANNAAAPVLAIGVNSAATGANSISLGSNTNTTRDSTMSLGAIPLLPAYKVAGSIPARPQKIVAAASVLTHIAVLATTAGSTTSITIPAGTAFYIDSIYTHCSVAGTSGNTVRFTVSATSNISPNNFTYSPSGGGTAPLLLTNVGMRTFDTSLTNTAYPATGTNLTTAGTITISVATASASGLGSARIILHGYLVELES